MLKMHLRSPFTWIGVLLIGAYIVLLGVRPLMLRDEFRYAEIPREMLVSGDWLVPRLDGIRYFEKPVLGYWMIAGAMKLWGPNRWAVRFPAAFSALMIVLAFYFWLRVYSKKIWLAPVASVILLSTAMFFSLGCINILDMPFTLYLSLALIAFFIAYHSATWTRRVWALLFCGPMLACAFMVKGFLAYALGGIIIVPYLFWEKELRALITLALPAVLLSIAIVVPWAWPLHLQEPDFWPRFFWEEHIKRFLSNRAQHAAPVWFFIPVLLGGAMPWTFLAPIAWQGWQQTRINSLIRFAICWFVAPFCFFSISKGKLPTYLLPCMPPLALLLAHGLLGYLASACSRKLWEYGLRIYSWLALLAGLGLLLYHWSGSFHRLFSPCETWKCLLVALALWQCGFCVWLARRSRPSHHQLAWLALTPLTLMICFHLAVPDMILQKYAPGDFLRAQYAKLPPNSLILGGGRIISAVCWCYRRTDITILDGSSETSYGVEYADSQKRALSRAEFAAFLAKIPAGRPVVVFMMYSRYRAHRQEFPSVKEQTIAGNFACLRFK